MSLENLENASNFEGWGLTLVACKKGVINLMLWQCMPKFIWSNLSQSIGKQLGKKLSNLKTALKITYDGEKALLASLQLWWHGYLLRQFQTSLKSVSMILKIHEPITRNMSVIVHSVFVTKYYKLFCVQTKFLLSFNFQYL